MYISRKYKTVTYENRCQIQEMLKTNKSITIMEVAERMNFEYSTIYREIRRGTNEDGVYDAQYAQKQYEISMNNRGRKERIFDKNGEMYKFLRQKLIDECVSPQTALDELKKSGIKTDEQYPSKATLYRMQEMCMTATESYTDSIKRQSISYTVTENFFLHLMALW